MNKPVLTPTAGSPGFALPEIAVGSTIPRILHQTYPTPELPPRLEANVRRIREENGDWEYRFYADADVESFIAENYGPHVLSAYLSIDKRYGAARADLFRYLVIYKEGGVYLDIKSCFSRPIDSVLTLREGFVLSHWSNRAGEKHENAGMHSELADMPNGEFQQWHVIGVKGHPFLRAVIEQVLSNIREYRPWSGEVGSRGVLRLTGPITYTRTIAPLVDRYPCKLFRNEQALSLRYSVTQDQEHHVLFKHHYSRMDAAIIRRRGIGRVPSDAYILARRIKRGIFDAR